MKLNKYHLVLLLIFLFVFVPRVYITVQTDLFSDDKSYFVLRQVENIKNTGLPLYNDSLSYGGRTLLFSPLFHYLLGLLYFIIPSAIALKLFLNLIAAAGVIGIYLIVKEITRKENAALISCFVSGFIPIYFKETVNALSIYSIAIPLFYFSIYYLIKLNKDKRYSNHFLISIFSLIILTPSSIIIIIGLLIFLLLSAIEKIKIPKANYEVVLVTFFLYLWFNFILFKSAILFHGTRIIWQNIPQTYLLQYFSEIKILELIYLIGIIPFFLGVYGAYLYITKYKSIYNQIILGIGLSIFIVLWFKLIPIVVGMIFLGSILVIILGQYLKTYFDYIKKTKFDKFSNLIIIALMIMLIITSVFPSIALGLGELKNVPTEKTLLAYEYILKNSNPEDTILTSENNGHALAYFTERKNVIDDNFIFIKDVDQRLFDIKRIYVTRFSQEALELLCKYDIDYVIIDSDVSKNYGVDSLHYTSESIESINRTDVNIYRIECAG